MIQELLEDKGLRSKNKEKKPWLDLQTGFAEELGKTLGAEFEVWVKSLPEEIFKQISALHRPSMLNPDQNRNHWKYELNMIRSIVPLKEEVLDFFEVDANAKIEFLKELFFMIIISDIGKAGPVLLNSRNSNAVVPRIYNNLILESKHGNAVREICERALDDSKASEVVAEPSEKRKIRSALRSILRINSGLRRKTIRSLFQRPRIINASTAGALQSQLELFLEKKQATAMPIELAMIVAREIAESETEDQSQKERIARCFRLRRGEARFLKRYGFDVKTTPISKFYTEAHIVFGRDFLRSLASKLGNRLMNRAMLGLRHHLAQGAYPDPDEEIMSFIARSKESLPERRDLKIIAFLEILDKVEAAIHRPGSTNPFASEDPEVFLRAINKHLIDNYSNGVSGDQSTYLFSIYQEVFAAMQQMGIFQKVKEAGKLEVTTQS